MLDHWWNERVGAQPFFIIIILVLFAEIFLYGAGFIRINDSVTERLRNIDTTTDDGTSFHVPSRSSSDKA